MDDPPASLVWPLLRRIRCFSHCGNNTGKEAGFPTLNMFGLISKISSVFPRQICVIFEKVREVSWKSFSDNRWWIKYEVFMILYTIFSCVGVVILKIVQKHIAPANASKLLKMLQNPVTLFYIKIELAACIEVLKMLVELTNSAESECPLVFRFSKKLDDLIALYPDMQMCALSSVVRLIEESVQ
jgi:hypothetical protein